MSGYVSDCPVPATTVPGAQPGESRFVSASAVLQQLHDSAPQDRFTIGWVMKRLGKHSFSIVLLMLAIGALAPGICSVAGPLIAVAAFQMTIGHAAPFFPRAITERPLPARHLRRIVPHAIAGLRFIEIQIHPRWPALIRTARQPVGIIILLLTALLILIPIPLTNIGPALSIAIIALAYFEQDGLALLVSLLAGVAVVILNAAFVWHMI